MTSLEIIGAIRKRFHPLYHARRVPAFRAALAEVDKPVWARLDSIDWPVRVRVVRHASFRLPSTNPERDIAALARAIVDVLPIRRFVDVGSNFGYYAWLLKSRSPRLSVDLLEPELENLELIRATLARTPLEDVRVHPVAASNATGRAAFERDVVSGATGTLEVSSGSYAQRNWGVSRSTEVATSTLDELIASGVDLLKIDVEGHEEHVLEGAAELLERDSPVVLFECFHRPSPAFLVLRERGYALFDAERFNEPSDLTSNYLGVPARFAGSVNDLRSALVDRTRD